MRKYAELPVLLPSRFRMSSFQMGKDLGSREVRYTTSILARQKRSTWGVIDLALEKVS